MTTSEIPVIEFFDGVSEELSDVSLRQNRATGDRTVLMTFEKLNSIERLKSYTKRFNQALHLTDQEGRIEIAPDSVKFFFADSDGDDLIRAECRFTLHQEDHWERFLRFMNRYAEAHGMQYGEPGR